MTKTKPETIKEAAEATTDPKALSNAAVTEKPVFLTGMTVGKPVLLDPTLSSTPDGTAFDHDGDGKVGGSKPKPLNKETLEEVLRGGPTAFTKQLADLNVRLTKLEFTLSHFQSIYQWPMPEEPKAPMEAGNVVAAEFADTNEA